MLGEGKKSGIISRSLLYEEFSQKSLSGLNWDIFWSLSALVIFMVHIPFKKGIFFNLPSYKKFHA